MTIAAIGAIQTAVQVTAHNVANSITPGFEPSRVVFQAGPAGQVRAHVEHPRHRLDEGEGGDESEEMAPSGTDTAKEMTNLVSLQHSYGANLKAFQMQSRSLGLLIDTVA